MDQVSRREQLRARRDRHRNAYAGQQSIRDRGVKIRNLPPLNPPFTYYYSHQSNNALTTSHSQSQSQSQSQLPPPPTPPQRPGTPDPFHMDRQGAYEELHQEHEALKGANARLKQSLFIARLQLKEAREQNKEDNEQDTTDVVVEEEDAEAEASTEWRMAGAFSNLAITLKDGKDEMDVSN